MLEVYFKSGGGGGGGNGDRDWAHWTKPDPGAAVDSNGFHTEESCTQYNVLKVGPVGLVGSGCVVRLRGGLLRSVGWVASVGGLAGWLLVVMRGVTLDG